MRIIFVLLGLVLLWSCNPVKRAIKRKAAIDAAIADYVAANPPRIDTLYLKGAEVRIFDTIVNENIYTDTIRIADTIYIKKVQKLKVTETIRATDTLIRMVLDDQASAILRQQKDHLQGQLDSKEDANKWLIWGVIGLSFITFFLVLARLFR